MQGTLDFVHVAARSNIFMRHTGDFVPLSSSFIVLIMICVLGNKFAPGKVAMKLLQRVEGLGGCMMAKQAVNHEARSAP